MKEYTSEEISRIAAERCPNCDVPMSYNNVLKGFTCDYCHVFIDYVVHLECKEQEHIRVDKFIEEYKRKREERKKANS